MFPFGPCAQPGVVETLLTLTSVSPAGSPQHPNQLVCQGTTLAQFQVTKLPDSSFPGCPPYSKNPACWDPPYPGHRGTGPKVVAKVIGFLCPPLPNPPVPGMRLVGKYSALTMISAKGQERCRESFTVSGVVLPIRTSNAP